MSVSKTERISVSLTKETSDYFLKLQNEQVKLSNMVQGCLNLLLIQNNLSGQYQLSGDCLVLSPVEPAK